MLEGVEGPHNVLLRVIIVDRQAALRNGLVSTVRCSSRGIVCERDSAIENASRGASVFFDLNLRWMWKLEEGHD